MPMLAELIDAVVGADTHRDTHELEIAQPSGAPIDVCSISNDTRGYGDAVAWIAEHAPGPRVVVAVEGTRSYGAGLARALSEAGLMVIECEQPTRAARRGRGKSDAIDAHLAVLTVLRVSRRAEAGAARAPGLRRPSHRRPGPGLTDRRGIGRQQREPEPDRSRVLPQRHRHHLRSQLSRDGGLRHQRPTP